MPRQGVSFNEHRSECGVTAPQAQNFAFLGNKIVKNLFVLLPFPIYQAPASTFAWHFWGPNDSLGALGGGGGGMALWPPGSAYVSMETRIKTRTKNRINWILRTQE